MPLLQVASIVGRAEVLSCIFFILSILSYCKGVSKGQGPSLSPLPSTNWSYVMVSVLLCLCSMLSKEQGIVALGVCATFDVILHWNMFWEGLFSFILRAKQNGPAAAAAVPIREEGAAGNGDILLRERVGIGGVIEEQNGNVVSGKAKTVKRNREFSGKTVALAKRLGNQIKT
jgi:hypothetical protein